MSDVKRYSIGGTEYELRPLVFGQWQQLSREIKGLDLPETDSHNGLIIAVGDRLDRLMAIALTPKGVRPQDKNIDELAVELAFSITPEQVKEVVSDFFIYSSVESILDLMTELLTAAVGKLKTSSPELNKQ